MGKCVAAANRTGAAGIVELAKGRARRGRPGTSSSAAAQAGTIIVLIRTAPLSCSLPYAMVYSQWPDLGLGTRDCSDVTWEAPHAQHCQHGIPCLSSAAGPGRAAEIVQVSAAVQTGCMDAGLS